LLQELPELGRWYKDIPLTIVRTFKGMVMVLRNGRKRLIAIARLLASEREELDKP
jgi:hypothetical protein